LGQAARECALGDRPVRLKVRVEPGDLTTTGDPERLHQVVANLLDNAVRHSPPEGRVWLSAHAATAGRTTIVVSDEGPGIPGEEVERVFERFHRTDAARATRDGGTGLGLAIARWIVDAHGGVIRAEPRNVLFMKADAAALPFVDGSFDVVVSRFAVHHFENPAVQIAEMRRVLRPGGRLAVADLVSDPDPEIAETQNRLERLRDPS